MSSLPSSAEPRKLADSGVDDEKRAPLTPFSTTTSSELDDALDTNKVSIDEPVLLVVHV